MADSQNEKDARVEALWKQLDPANKGFIDLTALEKGLHRLDHPLKDAHDLLVEIAKAMDKNHDQVIQYEGASVTPQYS